MDEREKAARVIDAFSGKREDVLTGDVWLSRIEKDESSGKTVMAHYMRPLNGDIVRLPSEEIVGLKP